MPAPDNSDPVQKQLLQLTLDKGVNERDRPETADPASTLSRVENLLQDQGGSWVKRYGTPKLGGVSTDDNGVGFNPVKLLRLKGGLGMISGGKFYQYVENISRFTSKDELPDFNVIGADQVVSSGPSCSPKIHSVASSTKFHAMAYEAGVGVTFDNGYRIVLYDRNSGAVVKSIDPGTDIFGAAVTTLKLAFVGDRYLHVWALAGTVKSAVYDTAAVPIALVTTAIVQAASPSTLVDIDVTSDRSFALTDLGGTTTLRGNLNTGVAMTGSATTTSPAIAISVFGTSVWYTTTTNAGARLTTNLATVAVADAAGGPGNTANIVATSASLASGIYGAITSTPGFGGSTISRIVIGGFTIDGWALASKPFTLDGDVYVHLVKSAGLTVASHVIAKVTYGSLNQVTGQLYNSLRLAAGLEPMLGVANSDVLKYFLVGTAEYCPAVAIQSVARGYAYCVFSAKSRFHSNVVTQVFGGQNYISGGAHCVLGANRIQESGFADMPIINGVQSGTAGPTGSFKHIAVYRFVDESGAVTWSRTSVLDSTTTVNKGVDVVVSPPAITMRDVKWTGNPLPQLQSVEVYRTKSGGTVYYLCGSSQTGTPASGLLTQLISLDGNKFYSFTDVMTDANLITQPTLFRQPGTANAAVDRYPPPASNLLCQHKDRLFTTDPYGVRVYYSSFFVDGETAWYNPAFSFFVHGGSGPITGLVSMDGRLFVFKRDGIFVVDGDGPAEGGVSGNEYSPPMRLATEYGCVDHRSIVVTTQGVVYRSARGIEILTRSLQVKWLGERVQTTVDANTKVTGSVLDTFGRVHICLAASDSGTSSQQGTITGVELVYDFSTDAWSISKHTGAGGTANHCVQDICMADLYDIGETVCYADSSLSPNGCVCYTNPASGLDRGASYIGWTVETVWIRMGQQMRQRFTKAFLLAKKLSGANHKIVVSVAYNFVDSYTQVATFQPNVINAAAIEELSVNLATEQALAIRLLIQESAPTDTGTYPVGTGRGCDLLGLMVEAAAIQGAPRLAAGQKS